MNKAEEFLQKHATISHFYNDEISEMICFSKDVEKAMIEFAQEMCELQKIECAEAATTETLSDWDRGGESYDYETVDKKSIYNCKNVCDE